MLDEKTTFVFFQRHFSHISLSENINATNGTTSSQFDNIKTSFHLNIYPKILSNPFSYRCLFLLYFSCSWTRFCLYYFIFSCIWETTHNIDAYDVPVWHVTCRFSFITYVETSIAQLVVSSCTIRYDQSGLSFQVFKPSIVKICFPRHLLYSPYKIVWVNFNYFLL